MRRRMIAPSRRGAAEDARLAPEREARIDAVATRLVAAIRTEATWLWRR